MSPATVRVLAAIPAAMVVLPLLAFAIGLKVPIALIIFLLLFGLMLTGMPVSISLGLTVLTFLFLMTNVPITSVALKLFTGIEPVSYTHLRAHETRHDLVCRLLLEK